MGWFALNSAIRSLVLSNPHPDTVVISSHIEAIIFGLFRILLLRKKTEIVWLGFIFTTRRNAWINWLRGIYFGFIFSFVDKVICHSSLEVKRYTSLFGNSRAKFKYIPYGLQIFGREKRLSAAAAVPGNRPFILAAGRSGRDYGTLFEAVEPLEIDLHVVCDSENALAGLKIPPNVSVLRKCYGSAYVNELNNSLFVVIPLGVNDISAGQMVLIQAMAFAKPTIVTRTETIEEYVSNEVQSLLVTQGNVTELRSSIRRLIDDHELAGRLATTAVATFEERFCMKAFVGNLVSCLMPVAKPAGCAVED